MKILALIFCFLTAPALLAKTVVLSDIDDTLKVAHVHSTWGKLTRALNSDLEFLGMPELFNALKKSGKIDGFFYLSNAPLKLMRRSHTKFVNDNNFPAGTIWLRDDLSDQEHKLYHLRKLAREERPNTIILFGDNGEWDAEFYATFAREFPHIRMVSFIRYLYAEGVIPAPQIPFVSALDPYLTLKNAGFIKNGLKEEQIIARQILTGERDNAHDPVVFPAFLDCPGFSTTHLEGNSDLTDRALARVENICSEAPFYGEETEYRMAL